jgi:site-specific recombinase XerD
VPKVLIEPLNEDELRKITLCIPQHTADGARNFAIVLTFVDTGVRLAELVNLKLEDIDFGVGRFTVFGKGGEERSVPIGITAKRAMVRYIEHFRPEPVNPRQGQLFLTGAGNPLSRNSVSRLVGRLAKRADVPRLHPHLFRHTFAVRYLVNGGDVFTLQKILGHESLEMTRRYVKLASVDVVERHRICSPVDNLGIAYQKQGRPKRRR